MAEQNELNKAKELVSAEKKERTKQAHDEIEKILNEKRCSVSFGIQTPKGLISTEDVLKGNIVMIITALE